MKEFSIFGNGETTPTPKDITSLGHQIQTLHQNVSDVSQHVAQTHAVTITTVSLVITLIFAFALSFLITWLKKNNKIKLAQSQYNQLHDDLKNLEHKLIGQITPDVKMLLENEIKDRLDKISVVKNTYHALTGKWL